MSHDHIALRVPNGKLYHAVRTNTMRGRCASMSKRADWHPEPGAAVTCPTCLKILAGIWSKNTPTYETWSAMKNRCKNPSHVAYRRYGGRGIKVCDRWRESFAAFVEDMGERPPGMTLDRIDPDGDYTPENCRWATMKQQINNRRDMPKHTAFGKTQTLGEWCDEYRIAVKIVWQRINKYGWALEEALTMTPVRVGFLKGQRRAPNDRVLRADLPAGVARPVSPHTFVGKP